MALGTILALAPRLAATALDRVRRPAPSPSRTRTTEPEPLEEVPA